MALALMETHGYKPLLDSTHLNDAAWFEAIEGPYVKEGIIMICFNAYEELSSPDKNFLVNFFRRIETAGDVSWGFFEKIVDKPTVIAATATNIEGSQDVEMDTSYKYRQLLLEELDIMVVEICKPHCEPISTAVFDYSVWGEKDIFSNFYSLSSWGICDEDNSMMADLWEWKKMTKEFGHKFDPNTLVEQHIERVEAGRCAEPRVWKKDLEAVVEMLEDEKWRKQNLKRDLDR